MVASPTMKVKKSGVPALQHPDVVRGLAVVEHARQKPVEGNLTPEAMQINGVATRPLE